MAAHVVRKVTLPQKVNGHVPRETIPETFPGVRIAREADEVALFSLLTLMHAENGMAAMSAERVLDRLRSGTRGQGGLIGVIDGPDGPEASVGLFFSQLWYAPAPTHVEESWLFVRPEYRQKNHATKLVRFAKWTSKRIGLPLMMGVMTKHRLTAKLRLYQREMTQVGAVFYDGLPADEFFAQKLVAASTSRHDVQLSAAADRPNRAA